jgi:hypothetical protein
MAEGARVLSPPRPDLRAHREAASLPFPELVEKLVAIIGKRFTAYIGSVSDARAVDRWIDGRQSYNSVEGRLRLAYHVAAMLSEHEGKRVVQSWLAGLNPELDDRVPLTLLREGDIEKVGPEILTAARAFIAGG